MKVYPIINNFGFNEMVCGSKSDAEEMILSFAEEGLYEDYYSWTQFHEGSYWNHIHNWQKRFKTVGNIQAKTFEGCALVMFGGGGFDYDYQEFEVV